MESRETHLSGPKAVLRRRLRRHETDARRHGCLRNAKTPAANHFRYPARCPSRDIASASNANVASRARRSVAAFMAKINAAGPSSTICQRLAGGQFLPFLPVQSLSGAAAAAQ